MSKQPGSAIITPVQAVFVTRDDLSPEEVVKIEATLLGVTFFARELGVAPAHISNVTSDRRKVGPTLKRALVAAGYVIQQPYPYLKIRRDDPESAARSITKHLGDELALVLAGLIIDLTTPDVSHYLRHVYDERRRRSRVERRNNVKE